MWHSYLLILLLFSSVTVVLSNPIAVFFDSYALKNNSVPVQTLRSHGVILTEQYVLSTKFPLQLYNSTDLCVIPREQLKNGPRDGNITAQQAQHFCKDVERSREADNYDLCVTELTEPLIFTFRIEVAPIPATKRMLIGHGVQLDLLTECAALLNLRLDTDPSKFPYSTSVPDLLENPYPRINAPENERTEVYLALKKDKLICDSDNAMPLYCNHVVVGLFRLNEEVKNRSECTHQKERLIYVNLINPIAQSFLKDFYETGPWPPTMAPNVTENMTLASSATEVAPN